MNAAALNPELDAAPLLDPKDQFLLLDPSSSSGFGASDPLRAGSGTSTPIAHVPWLRKTEYISRDSASTVPKISQGDAYVLPSMTPIFCLVHRFTLMCTDYFCPC